MNKSLKKMLVIFAVVIFNIALLVNTVQAVENGEKITIYSKGYFDRIIKKDQIIVKTTHAVYQKDGKEYPVYCLDRELHGVGEYIAQYDVTSQGKLTDLGLWKIIINGYPYKTLEQLGVLEEQEAYIATKQAIYCYIYNTKLEQYSALNDAGTRTINAMRTILENANNSTEDFNNSNIEVIQSEEWQIDENETTYISKQYEIKSSINISRFILNLENQPKGTKITNLENQEKSEFESKEKFKILIPINSLEKSGEFKVKIQTEMETKPIFYGKAPSGDLQDYALTAFSYEDFETEIIQKYEKIDKEPEEPEIPKKEEEPKKEEYIEENVQMPEVKKLPVTGM